MNVERSTLNVQRSDRNEPISDYAAVKDYLYALKVGGVKFGIDRMQRLAVELNHPERS